MVAFGQLARCQQADLITTKGRAFVRSCVLSGYTMYGLTENLLEPAGTGEGGKRSRLR